MRDYREKIIQDLIRCGRELEKHNAPYQISLTYGPERFTRTRGTPYGVKVEIIGDYYGNT